MKRHKIAAAFVCSSLAMACQQGPHHKQEQQQQSPASGAPSAQQTVSPPGAERKLAHKSQVNFEVTHTLDATRKIESQVRQTGGFILQSHIDMTVKKEMSEPVSVDSVKKIRYYEMQNSMVVRVPDSSLASFLNFIDGISTLTRVRQIDAEDLSLGWVANQLEQQRLNSRAQRPGSVQFTNDEADRNALLLRRLEMKDALQYSTVQLDFHQPLQYNIQYEANAADWAGQPPFFKRAGYAFATGFAKCKDLFIFLIRYWWVIILLVGGWWVNRRWAKWANAWQQRMNKAALETPVNGASQP